MRRYTLDRYKEAIELANDWDCPYVCAIPGPVNSLINPPDNWMRNWFIEGMKELVEFAKGSDVEIILENVPFTFLPTADDMLKVADDIDPSVGHQFRHLQLRLYQGRLRRRDPQARQARQERAYFRQRLWRLQA